jgi:NAD(P)-dependent dehydrogenase (short-subunit alcohol dehydrogenase family)
MSGRFAGRAIQIAGSTGIAAATADRLAAEGAAIFVVSRTPGHCRDLIERLVGGGGRAAYLAGDLTDESTAPQAVEGCVRAFGRVDGGFNVAGISGRRYGDGPIHEATADGWDATLDTNVKSAFFLCRALVRQMLTQEPRPTGERGVILNMSSVLAFSPSPTLFGTHAYAASKGAIIAMSRSIASYYVRSRIRVNVIAPALTRTPMSRRAQNDPAVRDYVARKQPLVGGMLEPGDVASVAAFLLSDDARAITGEVVTVDGGWVVTEA